MAYHWDASHGEYVNKTLKQRVCCGEEEVAEEEINTQELKVYIDKVAMQWPEALSCVQS